MHSLSRRPSPSPTRMAHRAMLRTAQNTLRTHARTHARPALPPRRAFASSPQLDLASTHRRASAHAGAAGEPLPWFVDPATAPTATPVASSSSATLATAPVPTPPPAHLAPALHPLHAHLSTSPFIDKHSIKYIHAREADPAGSWCDWVVVASLKDGRERGLRGAMDGVKRFVRAHTLSLSLSRLGRPLTRAGKHSSQRTPSSLTNPPPSSNPKTTSTLPPRLRRPSRPQPRDQ